MALLLIGVTLSLNAVAQQTIDATGSLKGHGGNPKQFASVQITGPGRYAAMTNAKGEFKLFNVVPGHYTVRVSQGDHVEMLSLNIRDSRLELQVKW
jgi:hypothetical protein